MNNSKTLRAAKRIGSTGFLWITTSYSQADEGIGDTQNCSQENFSQSTGAVEKKESKRRHRKNRIFEKKESGSRNQDSVEESSV